MYLSAKTTLLAFWIFCLICGTFAPDGKKMDRSASDTGSKGSSGKVKGLKNLFRSFSMGGSKGSPSKESSSNSKDKEVADENSSEDDKNDSETEAKFTGPFQRGFYCNDVPDDPQFHGDEEELGDVLVSDDGDVQTWTKKHLIQTQKSGTGGLPERSKRPGAPPSRGTPPAPNSNQEPIRYTPDTSRIGLPIQPNPNQGYVEPNMFGGYSNQGYSNQEMFGGYSNQGYSNQDTFGGWSGNAVNPSWIENNQFARYQDDGWALNNERFLDGMTVPYSAQNNEMLWANNPPPDNFNQVPQPYAPPPSNLNRLPNRPTGNVGQLPIRPNAPPPVNLTRGANRPSTLPPVNLNRGPNTTMSTPTQMTPRSRNMVRMGSESSSTPRTPRRILKKNPVTDDD